MCMVIPVIDIANCVVVVFVVVMVAIVSAIMGTVIVRYLYTFVEYVSKASTGS